MYHYQRPGKRVRIEHSNSDYVYFKIGHKMRDEYLSYFIDKNKADNESLSSSYSLDTYDRFIKTLKYHIINSLFTSCKVTEVKLPGCNNNNNNNDNETPSYHIHPILQVSLTCRLTHDIMHDYEGKVLEHINMYEFASKRCKDELVFFLSTFREIVPGSVEIQCDMTKNIGQISFRISRRNIESFRKSVQQF